MRSQHDLDERIREIDGRGYKAYRALGGSWRFDFFDLHIDYVQGDPFASPSRVRVTLEPDAVGLAGPAFRSAPRRLGVAALLARMFAVGAQAVSERRGSGKSGRIRIDAPAQTVMPQTAVQVDPSGAVEARFQVGLPAAGRRVLGAEASELLLEVVPDLVSSTLLAAAHDADLIERHAATNEDAEHLRSALDGLELLAFVADGAVLPRRSGVDDRPLPDRVVPFCSPPSLRTDVNLPNAGPITGMGLPRGVTLIVGGGFHGKSTLLRAIESGVHNHRPGDGREYVVSVPDAVKVRAEDGRSVAGVDISGFIDGLPLDVDTHSFSSGNASGSTSQAAAIVEALESGARALLVDEDTSATNFMIRDRRMQALVPREGEPITPFIDRVRTLYDDLGISSVLVLGGSGDYLDVADTVVLMRDYVPEDATAEAHRIAREFPTGRLSESTGPLTPPATRRPASGSIRVRRGRKSLYLKVPGTRTLVLGEEDVDLVAVEQIASAQQVRAIGRALAWIANRIDGRRTTVDLLDAVEEAIANHGLDALDSRKSGDLAGFRRHELAAAMNRLRTLRVD